MAAPATNVQPHTHTVKREPLNREVVQEHLAILRKLQAPPDIIAIAERILRDETYEPATAAR
jgi:hypothetical protein